MHKAPPLVAGPAAASAAVVVLLLCAAPLDALVPERLRADTIPPRNERAISGSTFAMKTAGMESPDRQEAARKELLAGNIRPLSTVHGARYADYSHGVRLVSQTVWVNGESRSIFDVLKDPKLAPLLTDKGLLAKAKALMGLGR